MARTCQDCGAPISRCSRGRCRPCSIAAVNGDPDLKRRRAEGLQGGREAAAERIRQYNANIPAEDLERRREHGRRQYRDYLNQPDIRARSASSASRAQAGRKRTEQVLGWCPPELRDRYRDLVRSQRVSAADARRMIEAEIPGTAEHAKRVVGNHHIAQRLRAERDRAQAY